MIARVIVPLLALAAMTGIAQNADSIDMIFLNDAAGSRRAGKIVGFDGERLKLEVPLGADSAAKATVTVPRGDVDRIEFAPNEALDRLLVDPSASVGVLAGEWRKWQPYLTLPKSPAPAVGNAYATALLKNPAKGAEALEVFSRVESDGWSEEARQEAGRGRLRAMVATGHAEEAVGEARKLADESEDPTVLIEAKYILAEAAFTELRTLVEENPRWTEDLFVRPEYYRLYNNALDLYLHPALFLGSEGDAASRGLWGAVKVYEFGGDATNAAETAEDIVMLYPDTRFAELGRKYLEEHPTETAETSGETADQEDR